MAGKKPKGGPPKTLTGQVGVRSLDSPWWDQVASEMIGRGDLVGKVLTIEELTQMVPDYPDGRRPKCMAVSRRLSHIIELVSRGPNGSRSRGATYRIVDPPQTHGTQDDGSMLKMDEDWLEQSIRKMTGDDD